MLSVGSYENVDEYSGKVQFNWKHDKIIKIIIINIINKRFVFYCAVRKTGRSFFTGLFKDSERERWKCYRFYNIYLFFFLLVFSIYAAYCLRIPVYRAAKFSLFGQYLRRDVFSIFSTVFYNANYTKKKSWNFWEWNFSFFIFRPKRD